MSKVRYLRMGVDPLNVVKQKTPAQDSAHPTLQPGCKLFKVTILQDSVGKRLSDDSGVAMTLDRAIDSGVRSMTLTLGLGDRRMSEIIIEIFNVLDRMTGLFEFSLIAEEMSSVEYLELMTFLGEVRYGNTFPANVILAASTMHLSVIVRFERD